MSDPASPQAISASRFTSPLGGGGRGTCCCSILESRLTTNDSRLTARPRAQPRAREPRMSADVRESPQPAASCGKSPQVAADVGESPPEGGSGYFEVLARGR